MKKCMKIHVLVFKQQVLLFKYRYQTGPNGAKTKLFWQLAVVNCQDWQFIVVRRIIKILFYVFCWVLWQRGRERN